MADTVADGKVVTIHFTLTTEGEVANSTAEGSPIDYLHGAQNVVPGLESALTGSAAGDTITATIAPEDAYGARVDAPAVRVPRDQFPSDMPIQVGMPIGGETPEGEVVPFWITQVDDDTVVVDPNHPLAGKTLDFEVKIIAVRSASKEEVAHGHPHGPEGHHH